jgi:hypothetical protein
MRFVSRYGGLTVVIRPIIEEAYATGMAKVIQQPIYANFSPYQLTPDERELAIHHWAGWNGFYQELDEVSEVKPDYRIGVWDSDVAADFEGWDPETKAWVEERMIKRGEQTNDLIPVPLTMLSPPWPKYDEFKGSTAALVRKLLEEGHDLGEVLAYEQAVQKREKVIEALEEVLSDPDAAKELEAEETVVA